MKLFKGWLKRDKAAKLSSETDKKVENKTVKAEDRSEEQILKMEKKKFVDRYNEMSLLTITATIDDELIEVYHKNSKSSHALFSKTKLAKDKLLEYISTIDSAKVYFKGPLLKLQDLLKSISDEWYSNHVTEIKVTDGLRLATKNDAQKWSDLILHIFSLYGEFFKDETPMICRNYFNTEPGVFRVYSKLSEVSVRRFLAYRPYMHLTSYEALRHDLFVGTSNRRYSNKEHWELASKIIREEADSYEENGNTIDFVINGNKKCIGFEPVTK